MKWHLIRSAPSNAFWNMAVDEALFACDRNGVQAPVLRLYTWQPQALSIGYFQMAQDLDAERRKRPMLDFVRRSTGGAAILHAHELTYCICMPSDGVPGKTATEMLYISAHKALIRALGRLGVRARMLGSDSTPTTPSSPFCFSNPSRFDVMVGERKIFGSAQRRQAGRILQHGSIPIGEPENVPHATSIETGAGRRVPLDDVIDAVILGFERQFGATFAPRLLRDEEYHLAEHLSATKYRTEGWNYKR